MQARPQAAAVLLVVAKVQQGEGGAQAPLLPPHGSLPHGQLVGQGSKPAVTTA